VRGIIHATLDLPLHLTLKTHLSYASYHNRLNYYQEAYNFGNAQQGHNSLTKASTENTQALDNFTLSYDNDLYRKHHIKAVIGFEEIVRKYNNINANETYIGIPGKSFVQTSNSNIFASGKYDPNYLIKSEFGRVSYNYDERYFISGTLRQDANFAVFGPNKKRGLFGAFSAAWNISNEPFFSSLKSIIRTLKIKGSYGSTGNSNIGLYNFLATYGQFAGTGGTAIGGENFSPGGPLIIANTINAIPNPNLHWERDYETNIGIDGTLFSDRLSFSVNWYKRTTKGMLYGLPLSLSSGYTTPYLTNIGEVTSKGTDISISYKNHSQKFTYNIKLTGSFNHNKVNNLGGITNSSVHDGYNYYNLANAQYGIMQNENLTITKAGLPFGSFYGLKALGLFKNQQEVDNYVDKDGEKIQQNAHAGDLKFKDVNGDGKITDADRTVIGNPNPNFIYGINLNFDYKNFELGMVWNGVAGVDIFNGEKAYEQYLFSDGNTTQKVFNDSFLGDNKLTSHPRLGVKNKDGSFTLDPNGNYSTVSSYFVENGSYIKLKNIELGYNFPASLLNGLGISNAEIYIEAYNLLTITPYSGLDPELGSTYSAKAQGGAVSNNSLTVTTRGIDIPPLYPHIKTYSVGIDIKF
jgi:TonB-linked SusC/RagA family outer membrane protein